MSKERQIKIFRYNKTIEQIADFGTYKDLAEKCMRFLNTEEVNKGTPLDYAFFFLHYRTGQRQVTVSVNTLESNYHENEEQFTELISEFLKEDTHNKKRRRKNN